MARGPGPLTQPRPETVAMPKRGKRLKFRAQDACSGRVTVADYANSDPAVVRSGRVKKAVANAVQQEVKSLCGLEASQVPAVEALSGAGEPCDIIDSSDEIDAHEESIHERAVSRKKKSKRHKDLDGAGGEEYPMDIWLLLASYIRPEDIVNFSLICKNAWTVTCTAAFWTRLYRRHYTLDASLPLRLRPESMEKLRCLRACVIRSLYHMYEPFAARISKNPAIPESTPSTLKNSKCLLFWCRKIVGNRQEPMWEFNFKFKKQIKEQVCGRTAASRSVRRCSHQPGPGLLPAAGHHAQFHLYPNCHGDDIHPVYHQREHGHAASPSETRVPGFSGPRWSETAQ
ncbi:transmembrane protein 183A isoform X5 [Camelus dromedarius]|uniref:Transmembrane protein 183A isoform X6 n=2 Tax=Camelus TaxID=9836 RepID=A0A8B8RZ36_CAMFR|nr:transmembrane protein 183A isoform X6 [Camelus dromedarius]XP_032322609.1 transmembrane protein 183A isoform X6 [Camelus ferus]